MKFYAYTIIYKKYEVEDTYIIRLEPLFRGQEYSFFPGQYAYLVNPQSKKPHEPHPFSIASEPGVPYLEFCIKKYGQWTRDFTRKEIGEIVFVSEPLGNFILEPDILFVAFLVGGVGIAPVMSILRSLERHKKRPAVKLLYGNRRLDTVVYQKELEALQKETDFRSINVFSEEKKKVVDGYKGFITEEIITGEVRMDSFFYIIGPPIFINKTKAILQELGVTRVKIEALTGSETPLFGRQVL